MTRVTTTKRKVFAILSPQKGELVAPSSSLSLLNSFEDSSPSQPSSPATAEGDDKHPASGALSIGDQSLCSGAEKKGGINWKFPFVRSIAAASGTIAFRKSKLSATARSVAGSGVSDKEGVGATRKVAVGKKPAVHRGTLALPSLSADPDAASSEHSPPLTVTVANLSSSPHALHSVFAPNKILAQYLQKSLGSIELSKETKPPSIGLQRIFAEKAAEFFSEEEMIPDCIADTCLEGSCEMTEHHESGKAEAAEEPTVGKQDAPLCSKAVEAKQWKDFRRKLPSFPAFDLSLLAFFRVALYGEPGDALTNEARVSTH